MKKTARKFTATEKAEILKGFKEAKSKAEFCKERGIPYQTIYNWSKPKKTVKKTAARKVPKTVNNASPVTKEATVAKEVTTLLKENEMLKAKCDLYQHSAAVLKSLLIVNGINPVIEL